MEIHRDRMAGKLYISQKKYLEKVIDRFNMGDCKSLSIPLAAHFKLSSNSSPTIEEEIEKTHVLYSSVVGSLMYAIAYTRPNLSHVISVVSRFMHNPCEDHWDVVKWILHYVKGSFDKCLVFNISKSITFDVIGYVDSDYGGDLDQRRSISDYIFTLCMGIIS